MRVMGEGEGRVPFVHEFWRDAPVDVVPDLPQGVHVSACDVSLVAGPPQSRSRRAATPPPDRTVRKVTVRVWIERVGRVSG